MTDPGGTQAPAVAAKPTVGFIVVMPGWSPRDDHGRTFTWNPYPTAKEAADAQSHAVSITGLQWMVVRVDTTYTVVDDGTGDDDG